LLPKAENSEKNENPHQKKFLIHTLILRECSDSCCSATFLKSLKKVYAHAHAKVHVQLHVNVRINMSVDVHIDVNSYVSDDTDADVKLDECN